MHRKPSLTVEEFQKHWSSVHVSLVEKNQKTLRIVRYVQLYTDYGPMTDRLRRFRGTPAPFDGMAEIWYESLEALESLGDAPEAKRASRELRDDEVRFIDTARSPIWMGDEREVIRMQPK